MLKKIIAVAVGCTAVLANASMITSAEESNAENSVVTTIADVEESATANSTTEAEDPAEVGRIIRNETGVKVTDVISFDEGVIVEDIKNRSKMADYWEKIWVIGVDDERQAFRVYIPRLHKYEDDIVLYLKYEDVVNVKHEDEEDGISIGDLQSDGNLDVFDMIRMRRGIINGWNDEINEVLADVNADGMVTIGDLVKLQRWLLGAEDF